ncbi:MAG: hypothetical protein VX366_07225 [Candidatus Thermoplasmatota archaeon]|nr:hypothetical protein [Candidatus Thermoplasmatota archaeon]
MNIKYGRIMRVSSWEKASLLAEQGWKLVTVLDSREEIWYYLQHVETSS